MDKITFKQRMLQLKNYRESNPGKTYIDFKAFSNGGLTDDNLQLLFLQDWFNKRKQTGRFDKLLSYIKYNMLNARETRVVKSPKLIQQYIKKKNFPSNTKVGGYYDWAKKEIVLNNIDEKNRDVLLHEYTHSLKSSRPQRVIESIIDNTTILNRGEELNSYYTDPEEVYPRLMEFRKANNLDPLKTYGIPDIRQWRRTGKDTNILDVFLDDDAVLDLINNVAAVPSDIKAYKDGGLIPTEPTDPPQLNIVNGRRVNPYTGQPIATGLANAVFDIEDAANMTPVGDALTIKDIGKQAVDKDWAGAGISALGLLPIVGGSLYKSVVKKAAKSGVTLVGKNIPKVNKNATQDAINAFEKARTIPNEVLEKFTDERNRTLELLNTKKAREKAKLVDDKYNTDYLQTYNALDKIYQNTEEYFKIPHPRYYDMDDDLARINPHEGLQIDLARNVVKKSDDLPTGVVRHEIGHLVDNLAYPTGILGNPYLKELSNPKKYREFEQIKNVFNSEEKAKKWYDYLRKGTEKKSIMNLFDNYLREQVEPDLYPTTLKEFKKAIRNSPKDYNNMKRLLDVHKSPSTLFKDFQSVPLVDNSIDDKKVKDGVEYYSA